MLKDFLKRNAVIFIIGGVTVFIFVGIIILAQTKPPVSPTLTEISHDELVAEHTPILGSSQAQIKLVEFSDFECPYCKVFSLRLDKIIRENSAYINLGFRHFPLAQHSNARAAAAAAMAAHKQGKFWEYETQLFENQDNLSDELYRKIAGDLGLDLDKFENDRKDQEIQSYINADLKLATSLGVNATPTFYLDGKLMTFTNIDDFETQILEKINQVSAKTNIDMYNSSNATASSTTSPQNNIIRNVGNATGLSSPQQPTIIDSNTDEINVQEKPEENSTRIIEFTSEGFSPKSTTIDLGTTVTWKNKTENILVLKQLTKTYDELDNEIEIAPNASYSFTFYKSNLWTYKDVETGSFGSIFVKS